MTKLLVIDDEVPFTRALAVTLRAHGYEVDTAATGEEGLRLAASGHPDGVILDLGLPGIDGLEVLAGLRGWTGIPVLVLSARHTERATVDALDGGADDYVTKPFRVDELLARIRAVLRRRPASAAEPVLVTEDFTLDLPDRTAHLADGREVHLTPTEWRVVEVLVRHEGRLVTQRQLLQEAWGPEYGTETDYLRTYLAAVRRKLEPTPGRPRSFLTEPGLGYRFVRHVAEVPPGAGGPSGPGARTHPA